MGRAGIVAGLVVALVACTSSRDARPIERPTTPTDDTETTAPDGTSPDSTAGEGSDPSTTTTTSGSTTTTVAGGGQVRGTAVAGAAGEVEASGPPFPATNAYSEVVRLADGTCVGWADARGGSTVGLTAGAPVIVLDAAQDLEIGRGTVEASRWEDVSGGGGQFNCFFDWSATVTGAPAEFRIKVGPLAPWLARQDASGSWVASVSTDAGIGLIPSCPPVPAPPATAAPGATTVATTAAPTAPPGPPVSGWNAVGQYWSVGVAALCEAGLPVTAIARPCRPPNVGSEYIISVTDSEDPTVTYPNGSAIPAGTQLTVSVATGRPCG